jgi:outer membrane biosynthesis protein TonB
MKRGTLLSLLVGLVLLLSVQVAVAKGGPDKVGGPEAKPSHAPVAVVVGSTQQDEAPKADGHAHDQSAKAKPTEKTKPAAKADKPKAVDKASKRVAKGLSKKSTPPQKPTAAEVTKPHTGPRAPAAPKPHAGPPASEEPASTVEPTTVYLHEPHVGADSTTFQRESDCGGLTDAVVWHFVLNGLDHGTEPAQLTVTFKNAGVKTAVGKPVGKGAVQHFYVGTSTHDVLLGGHAVVRSTDTGKLVLSHVSVCGPEKPGKPEEPEEPEEPEKPEKPEKPNTPNKPDKPADADKPDEPVLPYTETESVDTTSAPYLPYTGDSGSLILCAAPMAAITGKKLRYRARRRTR